MAEQKGSNGNGRPDRGEREVFVISVAAEITGMHAQTLRTYDRMGLVSPERTRGGGRRYSQDDIEQLQEIQRLSHDEGVNLAGIKAIIDLQNRVRDLEDQAAALRRRLAAAERLAEGDSAGGAAGAARSCTCRAPPRWCCGSSGAVGRTGVDRTGRARDGVTRSVPTNSLPGRRYSDPQLFGAATPLNRSTIQLNAVSTWENIGTAWFAAVFGAISGIGSVMNCTGACAPSAPPRAQ